MKQKILLVRYCSLTGLVIMASSAAFRRKLLLVSPKSRLGKIGRTMTARTVNGQLSLTRLGSIVDFDNEGPGSNPIVSNYLYF